MIWKSKSLFAQLHLMVQRLDPLAWYAAFASRWNCKSTCPKQHLQWKYCDINWCGYSCSKQESNQAHRLFQCKWWQGERDDGCQMEKLRVSSPSIFSTRAKISASLPKKFCKLSIFRLHVKLVTLLLQTFVTHY